MELCALDGYGVPVFSWLQAAIDEGSTDQLVFFTFDLLYLNGDSTAQLPLIKRLQQNSWIVSCILCSSPCLNVSPSTVERHRVMQRPAPVASKDSCLAKAIRPFSSPEWICPAYGRPAPRRDWPHPLL